MTVTVAIRHEKALQLLQNLADLDLIDLLPTEPATTVPAAPKLSSFIGQLNTEQTVEQIDEQLTELRSEWNRPI